MRSKQLPQVYLYTHGFTRDEARSLMNPKLRSVKFTLLTRLGTLFKCDVNELFGYNGPKGSHLNALNHEEPPSEEDLLEGLSPKDIAELRRIAAEKRKKK